MMRPWVKDADRLLAIPITLNVQTMLIEPAAAITMAKVIRIVVLKCLPAHRKKPPKTFDSSISSAVPCTDYLDTQR
jgi:hypothetical protein